MDFLSVVYVLYAIASVGLTIWLARTLGKNGRALLDDVFKDNPGLADAINNMVVVGFYLANAGYACLLFQGGLAYDVQSTIETLASKLGYLLLSFTFMHFMNMFIFYRVRRRARLAAERVPVPHHGGVAPPFVHAAAHG